MQDSMKLKQLVSTERQGSVSPALVIAELDFVHTGGASRSTIVPARPRRSLWSLLSSSKATTESRSSSRIARPEVQSKRCRRRPAESLASARSRR